MIRPISEGSANQMMGKCCQSKLDAVDWLTRFWATFVAMSMENAVLE